MAPTRENQGPLAPRQPNGGPGQQQSRPPAHLAVPAPPVQPNRGPIPHLKSSIPITEAYDIVSRIRALDRQCYELQRSIHDNQTTELKQRRAQIQRLEELVDKRRYRVILHRWWLDQGGAPVPFRAHLKLFEQHHLYKPAPRPERYMGRPWTEMSYEDRAQWHIKNTHGHAHTLDRLCRESTGKMDEVGWSTPPTHVRRTPNKIFTSKDLTKTEQAERLIALREYDECRADIERIRFLKESWIQMEDQETRDEASVRRDRLIRARDAGDRRDQEDSANVPDSGLTDESISRETYLRKLNQQNAAAFLSGFPFFQNMQMHLKQAADRQDQNDHGDNSDEYSEAGSSEYESSEAGSSKAGSSEGKSSDDENDSDNELPSAGPAPTPEVAHRALNQQNMFDFINNLPAFCNQQMQLRQALEARNGSDDEEDGDETDEDEMSEDEDEMSEGEDEMNADEMSEGRMKGDVPRVMPY